MYIVRITHANGVNNASLYVNVTAW
jgi:hypothetical protein